MVQPANKRLVTEAALPEAVRNVLEASFVAGSGITITHNGGANTITIAATGSGGLDIEAVQDSVAAMILESFGLSAVYDDVAGTYTITNTVTDTNTTDPEVVRDTMAAALVAGTGITITPNDAGDTITIANANTQYTDEMARDALGAALVAGTGVTITVDDTANTITIAATGGGGGLDLETVQDAVAAMILENSGLSAVYDDTAGTYTITNTYGPETIRDTIGTALVAGAGVTITVDDTGDTITIAATGGGGGLDLEAVQDAVATMILEGSGLVAVYDDTAGTYTISLNSLLVDITNTASAGSRSWLSRNTTALGGGIQARTLSQTKTDLALVGADITDLTEAVQDIVGAFLAAGSGVTVTYNDAGNVETIAATGTWDAEQTRDTIGSALVAGSGITVTVNDAGDTITIANSNTQYTDEMARDAIGAALVAGTGVTVTVDDTANTITIAATGSGGMDLEAVQDAVAAMLSDTSTVTHLYNDATGQITLHVQGKADQTDLDDEANVRSTADTALGVRIDDLTTAIPETARDTLAAALVAGSGITITPDDTANTITIAATGGGGGLDLEAVQDAVATMIAEGSGLTAVYDDTAGTYTISTTGLATSAALTTETTERKAADRTDWPSYIPAGVLHDYDPRLNIYNMKASNTRLLRRGLGRAASGQHCEIAVLGDSTTVGAVSLAGPSWDRLRAWPMQMRDHLGVPIAGTGWVRANEGGFPDSRWSFSANWTKSGAAPSAAYTTVVGSAATLMSDKPGDRVSVLYYGANDGNAFKVSVDGVDKGTKTMNDGLGLKVFTVNAIVAVGSTVVVTKTTGVGTMFILNAADVWSSLGGLHVHMVGQGGSKAAGTTGLDEWTSQSNGNALGNVWTPTPSATGLAQLDAYFFGAGQNDLKDGQTAGTPIATTIAAIKAAYTTVKSRCPNADFVIVCSQSLQPSLVAAATTDAFVGEMYNLADTLDVPLIDHHSRLGPYATYATANGLNGDTDGHLKIEGQVDLGRNTAKAFGGVGDVDQIDTLWRTEAYRSANATLPNVPPLTLVAVTS